MTPLDVDYRRGSGELIPLLQSHGVPAQKTELAYGDMGFLGTLADGEPIPIGVERKALRDFISSVLTGRLAGKQLTGLLLTYKETWIVLEGDWRISHHGTVQALQWTKTKPYKKLWLDVETGTDKALLYSELEAMILTLELRGGMRFRFTKDKTHTCLFLKELYRWWTEGAGAHRSHLRFHSEFADKNLLVKPSLCRVMAAQLPGVGFDKSGPIAQHFGSVAAMVNANEKEWIGIKGVGKTMAQKIVQVLNVAGSLW